MKQLAIIDDGKSAPETVAAAVIRHCEREQTAAIAPMLRYLDAPNQARMTTSLKRDHQGIMTGNVIHYRLRKEQRPHAL